MSLILVGTNHQYSPVALREWIIANHKQSRYWLEYFKNKFSHIEIVVLSTCNRFEIYIRKTTHNTPDVKDILSCLAEQSGLPIEQFQRNFYCYRNVNAVRHLFRVACAMDSMLIGEHQITGQVRDAFQLAQKMGTTGTFITRLFQNSLKLAKRIRNEADISSGHFSLGSVAAEFVTRIFGTIKDKNIVIVGTGKMGANTLAHLIGSGAKNVTIINRDITRAKSLARSLPAVRVKPWSNLSDTLVDADVIITCIAADEPILRKTDMDKLAAIRTNQPMLIIDLGLPRNVEQQIGELPWIHLYDLNALETVLIEQNQNRKRELAKYEYLIDEYVDEYMHWLNMQTVVPVISALRSKLHNLAESELDWLDGKISDISAHDRELIEQMAYRLVQKILHEPLHTINEQTKNHRGNIYAGIVKKLFNLEEESAKHKANTLK